MEELDGRVTVYTVLATDGTLRSAVDLGDNEALVRVGKLGPVWRERLAVAAPRGEELNELVGVLVECLIRERDDLGHRDDK